jgi:hypothetical protein
LVTLTSHIIDQPIRKVKGEIKSIQTALDDHAGAELCGATRKELQRALWNLLETVNSLEVPAMGLDVAVVAGESRTRRVPRLHP